MQMEKSQLFLSLLTFKADELCRENIVKLQSRGLSNCWVIWGSHRIK